MGNLTFVGHLFIPQKSILSENPLKLCSKTRLLYHEDTLFIATREENSSNLKITNLLIYTLEADKRFHLLAEYSLKTPIDDIIGIDKTKVIVYGLSIDQNFSAFSILKIDILNHAEVNLYEMILPQCCKIESELSLNQRKFFCQTKILDSKYSISTIDCSIETMNNYKKYKSYLFFFDATVEKIYDLSYISEKIIKEIEIVQTTLLGGKYILFQTGRIGDSEKFDIIFEAIQEKKENFDPSDFRVNQKMIIYPLRKFFEDISIRNVDLERYCFERMDFNVVVPTCCRWFENDEFFYIKTFITQNKSELIRVKVSNNGVKRKETVCSLDERILSDSMFVKERILDSEKIPKKNLFYIVKASKINSYCFRVTILFFGKKIIKRDFYFEFEENENIIKLNFKKDYIITCKMHFNEEDTLQNPDHLYLTYKSYSFSNKQFIGSQDQVHMLYKDMVLDNPYNQMETLIYFY